MSTPILIALPKNYITTVDLGKIKQEPGDLIALQTATSKKRRLDHLSWEEKLQRKKMKNRVAAQTSRDRKKAKMDEMEYRIQTLEKTNVKLVKEMESLRAFNERLAGENESLKGELSSAKMVAGVVARADLTGPAESFPRQQEVSARPAAPATLTRLMMLYLLCRTSSLGWTPKNTSTALNNLPKVSSQKLIQEFMEQIKIGNQKDLIVKILEQKWWGPHQSMWNPVKIAL